MRRRRAVLASIAAGFAFAPLTGAAEESEVEAELLGFLGSVDDEDQDWLEYLERTDVAKVARAKKPPRPEGEER
jgi:hypothetical protein